MMKLYELAKNAEEARKKLSNLQYGETKETIIYAECLQEFAKEAGININESGFGIMLTHTAVQLVIRACEEMQS
jgi:hypothetical protein